jgi:hypothetical protein
LRAPDKTSNSALVAIVIVSNGEFAYRRIKYGSIMRGRAINFPGNGKSGLRILLTWYFTTGVYAGPVPATKLHRKIYPY